MKEIYDCPGPVLIDAIVAVLPLLHAQQGSVYCAVFKLKLDLLGEL
jgi:hypothetical protein